MAHLELREFQGAGIGEKGVPEGRAAGADIRLHLAGQLLHEPAVGSYLAGTSTILSSSCLASCLNPKLAGSKLPQPNSNHICRSRCHLLYPLEVQAINFVKLPLPFTPFLCCGVYGKLYWTVIAKVCSCTQHSMPRGQRCRGENVQSQRYVQMKMGLGSHGELPTYLPPPPPPYGTW